MSFFIGKMTDKKCLGAKKLVLLDSLTLPYWKMFNPFPANVPIIEKPGSWFLLEDQNVCIIVDPYVFH